MGIPVYAGIDFGVHPDFSVGVQASYSSFIETWDSTDYQRSVFGLIGVGNYHFNRILKLSDRWDLYAGIAAGFYFWTKAEGYYGENSTETGVSFQIGGRYFVTKKIGINIEMASGSSTTRTKLGISYLIKPR